MFSLKRKVKVNVNVHMIYKKCMLTYPFWTKVRLKLHLLWFGQRLLKWNFVQTVQLMMFAYMFFLVMPVPTFTISAIAINRYYFPCLLVLFGRVCRLRVVPVHTELDCYYSDLVEISMRRLTL